MGILFAFLSALFFAFVVLDTKLTAGKQGDPILTAAFFQIIAGVGSLALLVFDPLRAEFDTKSIILLLIVFFLYSGFNIFGFKANKYLDLSVVGILSQVTLIVTVLGAIILLGEQANIIKVIGIAIIIIGNVLVMWPSHKRGELNLTGVFLKLASSVCLGLAMLVDAVNSPRFALPFYGFLTYAIPGLITLSFTRSSITTIREQFARQWKFVTVMGFFGMFGYYFLVKAFALADKTVVVPINNISTIIVVLLGIILLKERQGLRYKLLAAVLVFAGAVMVGLA